MGVSLFCLKYCVFNPHCGFANCFMQNAFVHLYCLDSHMLSTWHLMLMNVGTQGRHYKMVTDSSITACGKMPYLDSLS